MNKVKDVKSFLVEIEQLKAENNIFFRGHSDINYILEPGIYRKDKIKDKCLIEFEDKIYREIISKAPQDFIGKNTLESLALMQHYEAPTRILDLTENALVALYFACIGNESVNGEVIVFDIPEESTCHYDSDRVTILANIAKCDKEITYYAGLIKSHSQNVKNLEEEKNNFGKDVKFELDYYKYFDKRLEEIGKNYEANLYSKTIEYLINLTKSEYESLDNGISITNLNSFSVQYIETVQRYYQNLLDENIKIVNKNYFGKLLHNIREDKSYFDGIINPIDISKVISVRPKLNNPRIIKQSGAFLLFGIEDKFLSKSTEYKPMAILDKDWILRGSTSKNRIIIDHKSKNKIIKELHILGFNESTLFPEVDKVSHFVKNSFLEKL